jgi:hypothetical protein
LERYVSKTGAQIPFVAFDEIVGEMLEMDRFSGFFVKK